MVVRSCTETVPLIQETLIKKSRPVWMERQWVAIDGLGTVRNSLYTTSVFLKSAAIVSKAIPGLQIGGGLLISYNALRYNLPEAWGEFKTACSRGDQEGKRVAGLSLTSQVCYGLFGPSFLVAGATGIAGLVTKGTTASACLQASEIAASAVLGGICVVRGLVMMGRSAMNLRYLIPFHKDFHDAVNHGEGLAFLRDNLGITTTEFSALERRMGTDAAKTVQAYCKDSNSMTPEDLIKIVDKGIFKQKCKQWLTFSIAVLMVIGGIASLVFSGGITAIVIAAIIGIAFTLMEAEWLVFDKASWFNAIVDKLYKPLPLIPDQNLIWAS